MLNLKNKNKYFFLINKRVYIMIKTRDLGVFFFCGFEMTSCLFCYLDFFGLPEDQVAGTI